MSGFENFHQADTLRGPGAFMHVGGFLTLEYQHTVLAVMRQFADQAGNACRIVGNDPRCGACRVVRMQHGEHETVILPRKGFAFDHYPILLNRHLKLFERRF